MSISPPEPDSATACPPPLMWQDVRREYLAESTERIVETPAGSVSVRYIGSGRPLYFLPGFTAPAELFCLLIWLLRDEYRCVTLEPSWSDGPRASNQKRSATRPNFQYEVEQLLTVADELHDDRPAIFGTDYGAAWGMATALSRPDRVSHLLLLNAFAHRRISVLERQLAWWGSRSRRTLVTLPFRDLIQTQNHRRWFPPFDTTRWPYFLETSGQMPVMELARRARSVMNYDLRAELPRLSTPTLLIRTEGDGGVATRCLDELEQGLPHVQTEWLHNTGHLAYLTHPHRLAKLVWSFVTETVGKSS